MAWNNEVLKDDGMPKWLQVAGILRQSLAKGEFGPGNSMPTEAQLNSVFGISRTTARAALNKLVQEGSILRRSGVGSVVIGARVDQPLNQIRGFTEDMLLRGLRPSFDVLSCGWGQASGEVTHALGLSSSDRPFRIERTLKANERLIGHSASWLRPDLFGKIDPPTAEYLATGSLYVWLQKNLSIEVVGGIEFIEAHLATSEMASALDVEPGSAVLVVTRVARGQDGLPVEFVIVTYRSDRYRFRLDL